MPPLELQARKNNHVERHSRNHRSLRSTADGCLLSNIATIGGRNASALAQNTREGGDVRKVMIRRRYVWTQA